MFWRKTYDVPPPKAIQSMLAETSLTDDMWWLEKYEWQWLFVYDRAMSIHDAGIIGAKFYSAYTKRDYILYHKDIKELSYPIALRSRLSSNLIPPWQDMPQGYAHKIKGELWLIRPREFFALDKAKDNGHTYLRKRITVVVPAHKSSTHENLLKDLQAWTYVGNPEVWRDQIKDTELYSLCPVYRPNNPLLSTYYFFSRSSVVRPKHTNAHHEPALERVPFYDIKIIEPKKKNAA
jgi:hypothetical protein